MSYSIRRFVTRSTMVLSLALAAASVQPVVAETLASPAVPDNLRVPSGNSLFLKANAVGTQNYVCAPSAQAESGFAWKFFGPQATLFLKIKWFGGDIQQQITTHFLSPNPIEGGTARPTWQHSMDTSAIWGKLEQESKDPRFVAPGAIAWLLVRIVGSQRGPMGGEFLTPTTFIQRVNTSGGVAPETGCTQATDGATVLVPYSTDYYFYKPSGTK
jgi:hypothetical protein